ncbi:hypothetical protein BG53_04760 [Paenibacillus darwinianus]|uniref:Uncharacterized protein n=2 Tax=Paenibacillus darwinianus TaxID=1380763 RepID=A0A9W5S0C3_9BACL|nr:hypothetical protein [Paenibacillus darwinianus]EXX87123.1 hypothetical protein BG53_04760 [Paenibacillus darwinianus]EXX88543.1 hypothetical protein CH50_03105 [Paenibacillus darwinianus]EXX88764.1 hypothetical protein BG52_01340 [Paenibacillus darwinianus]
MPDYPHRLMATIDGKWTFAPWRGSKGADGLVMRQSWKEQRVERAAAGMLHMERREALTWLEGTGRTAADWPGGHHVRREEPSAGV